MDLGTFVAACATISVILAALYGCGKLFLWCWTNGRRLARLIDDLTGEPGRAGMPDGRPGVFDRMYRFEQRLNMIDELTAKVEAIEREMKPNGGGSMRDKIDVIAASVPASPTPEPTPDAPGPNGVGLRSPITSE